MATDDLKSHATSTKADYYDLLSLTPGATDPEAIRRAYRKTALKYHPDKVGASNHAALEKFHLLQIAYDVLSDPELKDLYDNARRAREQVKERDQLLSARRRGMKEDLERREREGATGKRKWAEDDAYAQELEKMREDTKRRRVELEERRRWEMEALLREEEAGDASTEAEESSKGVEGVEEMDRSVKVRYKAQDGPKDDEEELERAFERFGAVEHVVVRPPKESSSKKKRQHRTALLVFKSVVGAHAAVADAAKLDERFEKVEWAAGKEPDFIPKSKMKPPVSKDTKMVGSDSTSNTPHIDSPLDGEDPKPKSTAPKFGSFKGATGGGGASLDEITMIRLKNAEKRRLEAKIRREEAAADDADAADAEVSKT